MHNNPSSCPLRLAETKDSKDRIARPVIVQYKNAIYFGKLNVLKRMQGLGMLFYNDGCFLIAHFQCGSIHGKYIYYNSQNFLVLFGQLDSKGLNLINYAYSRNKDYLRAQFSKGKILHESISIQIQPDFISQLNEPQTHKNQYWKMTEFLQNIAIDHKENPQKLSRLSNIYDENALDLFEIDKHQKYFGLINNGKPQGYGIVFVDEWPVCYGFFEDGEINGLARVQENHLVYLDGVFNRSKMTSGWVIDLKNKKLGFGISDPESDKFQLIEQIMGMSSGKIADYRKQQHLRSLYFDHNSAPAFNPLHYWPQTQIQKIIKDNALQAKIGSFSPSYISQISPVGEISSNRFQKDLVELLKEHNQRRNSHFKVSKILESRLNNYEQQIKKAQSRVVFGIKTPEPYRSNTRSAIYFIHKSKSKSKSPKQRKKLNLDKIYSKYLRK